MYGAVLSHSYTDPRFNSALKVNMSRCGRSWAKDPAFVCSDCSFGSKADNCCVCGKWMGSCKTSAHLCGDCSFGCRKDNCCRCGKWMGSSKAPAHLCGDCSFGSRKEECAALKH